MTLVLVRAAVGVEDRPPSEIRFLRVLAPENRMKDWPLGGEKYLPVAAEEFERLVAAMKPQDSKTPSAAIVSARYEAKLVGERLIGRATLDVTLIGPSSRLLPLAPCNVAIQKAAWAEEGSGVRGQGSEIPDLQISRSSNQDARGTEEVVGKTSSMLRGSSRQPPPSPSFRGPHPNPLPKGEGTSAHISALPKEAGTSWGNHAALGSGGDGHLGVFVERSGRLGLEWSLAGQRDSSDVLAFSFEIPAAASNQLFVELPDALMPKIDRGLIVGSEAVDAQSRRWQIELGGNDHLRLQAVPTGDGRPRRQLALLRESRTYDCSLRGLEVSAQWKLQVYNEPLDRISVLLDPGLQLMSARLGDVAIPWSAAPTADGGTRVTLRLPEPIRDTDRVIRLSATGRPVLDRAWRLPRIRAAGLLWLEGSISLLMPEPLAADRIVPLNCAQTGTGPLSAPRAGQSMQFQSFDRDATVEVSLSRCPARVDMLAGTAIELDSQQAAARIAARFHIANDTRFAIEADVAPGWIIHSVESVPSGGVADWSVEPRGNGRQRLAIQLATGLSPQQPVRLSIAAHRPFAASGKRLDSGDLPPLDFRRVTRCRQLVAVRPIGAYALKVHGGEQLKRFEPDDLVPSESALLAAKLHDLLFERNDRSDSLAVSLAAREPQYAGSILVDASVSDHQLREKFSLRCVPKSDRIDRVLVRLFPRRDATVRWTLGSSEGIDGNAAEMVALQNAPVSARRWSREEQTAAGVDPLLETWELTLRRPRGDAFEIHGVREVPLSGLPVVVSLASLPEATAQRGEVAVRSLRSESLSVENRRLKAILPEPPPPGQIQTIRGAYRYDPARDVAEGTKAAIRVIASSEPVAPAAWIGDCRLESWHQTDGTVRHLATYNLENAGCNRLRLAMPPQIAREELRGIRIDGVPAAWKLETREKVTVHNSAIHVSGTRRVPNTDGTCRVPTTVLSVELPANRKSLRVTVEWTAAGPPLGVVGSLTASLPEPDLPVLARHWIAWLPPGYESVGSDGYAPSADRSTSAGTQGWTGRCIDVPAGTPVALRCVRAASMQLFGAVVFLLAAGLGCWTVRRWAVTVFAALLGVFGMAAMTLPDAYVPVAWGGLFGVLFCLALQWVHRDRSLIAPSTDVSNRAGNANPDSTIAAAPIGPAMLGVLLFLQVCGAAVPAARAGETPAPQVTVAPSPPPIRGGSATATPTLPGATATPTLPGATATPKSPISPTSPALPPLPTVDGKVSGVARPASSPLYRVFVPVDAQQKPVGGKVYVPEAFYQELYRRAAPVEKPPAWLILGAVYRGDLTKEAVSGRLTVSGLRAQYDLRFFERATRVRIPLRTDGANLLPGSVLLDGRAIELEGEPDAGVFAFEVAEPGDYRLVLSLRPAMRGAVGSGGFDVAIPRVAGSRVELALPADAPPVEVPSACGGVSQEKDPPRLLAELGPTDRLTVRWQEPSAANGARLAVKAEQLTWLKIQPGSVVVNAKFKFHVAEGELRQVQLAVDPRLRLLPMPGDAPPSVQVGAESGQTRLVTIRWPRPISNDAALEAAFLFNGASAVGNIRLPRIELVDIQPTRRWMAVGIDTALDCEEQDGGQLEPLPVADFLKAWGQSDSKPRAAYRLPRGETGWTLSTRPHEPRTTANQTLSLSFDEDRLDVLFDARLSVASGYVFQHQVTAPKDFTIERVSLVVDRNDRVQRWSQDKDGAITVFLDGPVSGSQRLSIRGRLPIHLGERRELPLFAVQKCRIQTAAIQLFERPAVSLRWSAGVSPARARAAVSPARAEAGGTPALPSNKTPESGRLVETIVWDGVQRPSVTVIARPNRARTDAPRQATEPEGIARPSNAPGKPAAEKTARTSGFVRLADVAIAWQTGGRWCGVAALDIEPRGAEQLDLRLPGGCELIRASVEDMPAAPKRIGGGIWRLALASSESPQRVDVIYRGVMSATDAVGQLRFESPTLGDLPVRQTVWTVFLPLSVTADNPQGAASVSNRPGNLPCPSGVAAIGGMLPPRYYLSEEGKAALTLDCRPAPLNWPFHRWAAASIVLLFGMVSASILLKSKRRQAAPN